MGAFSDTAARQMLASLFIPDAHSYIGYSGDGEWLGEVYVALTKTPPIPGMAASSLPEPTAASYARAKYRVGSKYWSIINHSAVANKQAVYFTAPLQDWGLVSGWALCTQLSGGDVLAFGSLDPVRIAQGSAVSIDANNLVMSVVS